MEKYVIDISDLDDPEQKMAMTPETKWCDLTLAMSVMVLALSINFLWSIFTFLSLWKEGGLNMMDDALPKSLPAPELVIYNPRLADLQSSNT